MKKISSLILLITAAVFNASAPMAKSKTAAKGNPAIAATAAKFQAQPIVYIDSEDGLFKNYGISKSIEFNQLTDSMEQSSKMFKEEWDACYQKYLELSSKRANNEITQEKYLKESGALSLQLNGKIQEKYDEINTPLYEARSKVRTKLIEIAINIGKHLGASAVAPTSTVFYIDPAYDITQEAFDTLNKEYKDSQSKKSTCNHCCDVHCPTKCNAHCK